MDPEPETAAAEGATRAARARAALRADMRRLAERLAATLASVRDEGMRLRLLGEALSPLDAEAGAVFLDVVWSDIAAGHRPTTAVFRNLATLDQLEEVLGGERLDCMRGALAALGYVDTGRLLQRGDHGFVRDRERALGEVPRPREPVGLRISLARKPSARLMARLATDPDHRVIAALLRSLRMTEQEVVKLAASPRASERALEAIARDSRWVTRYSVALTLVYNPRTPARIALALLPGLLRQDLEEIAEAPRLTARVRERARALLELRGAIGLAGADRGP